MVLGASPQHGFLDLRPGIWPKKMGFEGSREFEGSNPQHGLLSRKKQLKPATQPINMY